MSSTDLDRRLTSWFDSAGAEYVPNGLLDDVFAVTREARQRRGAIGRLATAAIDAWRMPTFLRVAPRQLLYLAVVALLLVAAAIALAVAGSHRPAPPFGLAANGFIAFDRDGVIVIARPDGTEISEVAGVPYARGPVYAPDGTRFAFYGTVDGTRSILVASADGRDPIVVSTGSVIDVMAMETPMSWSPDSRRIAFGGLSGEQRRLFVATVDGSDTHIVGDDGLSRIDPAWSPDGAWIAFHGFRSDEDVAAGLHRTRAGLYLIRPDGGEQTLLVAGTGGDFIYRKPQWLPDPAQHVLAYQVGSPNLYDIALFDVDLMTETVISREAAAEVWPAWAPDGSLLAWSTSDRKIRIASAAGMIVRVLPADIEFQPVWSPDARFLFGWTAESHTTLAVMRSDGSSQTTVVPIDGMSLSHWSWQRQAP